MRSDAVARYGTASSVHMHRDGTVACADVASAHRTQWHSQPVEYSAGSTRSKVTRSKSSGSSEEYSTHNKRSAARGSLRRSPPSDCSGHCSTHDQGPESESVSPSRLWAAHAGRPSSPREHRKGQSSHSTPPRVRLISWHTRSPDNTRRPDNRSCSTRRTQL